MIEGEWGNYLKTDILAAIELAESQQRNDGEDGHNGGQCGCSAVVAADDLGIDCYRQGLSLAGIQDDCPSKLLPMLITSPVAIIWVPRDLSA